MTRPRIGDGALSLIVILLAVAVGALALFGCAPPQAGLHGRAALDRWLQTHVTIRHIQADDQFGSGLHDGVFYIDDDQVNKLEAQQAGAGEWLVAHEEGHAVALALGLHFVPDDGTGKGEEQKAEAVAAVITGATSPFDDPEHGYGQPPDEVIDQTRAAMELGGLW